MQAKIESLRRAVEYGLANGKKNVIADLDVLQAMFSQRDQLMTACEQAALACSRPNALCQMLNEALVNARN